MNFLNLLFPQTCILCQKPGRSICPECYREYNNINFEHRCHICDQPVNHGFIHVDCSDKSYLDGLIYTCIYNKLVKDLIKRAKYSYEFQIMKDLGSIMAEFYKSFYKIDGVVTSIPLSDKKLRIRGFNQAEVMARRFAKDTNMQYIDLIKRVRHTKSQVGMRHQERLANLKNAFEINLRNYNLMFEDFSSAKTEHKIDKIVDNKIIGARSVVVVDDVFTTGTTLNEFAKVIKSKNEDIKVFGLCFAKSRIISQNA